MRHGQRAVLVPARRRQLTERKRHRVAKVPHQIPEPASRRGRQPGRELQHLDALIHSKLVHRAPEALGGERKGELGLLVRRVRSPIVQVDRSGAGDE